MSFLIKRYSSACTNIRAYLITFKIEFNDGFLVNPLIAFYAAPNYFVHACWAFKLAAIGITVFAAIGEMQIYPAISSVFRMQHYFKHPAHTPTGIIIVVISLWCTLNHS